MPIVKLFYVSRPARPMDDTEVRQIVALSQRANRQRDITGLLVSTGRHFAQMIEGRPDAIDALWPRIEADPRHVDLKLLWREQGEATRNFGEWSMAHVFSPDLQDHVEAMMGAQPVDAGDVRQLLDRIAAMARFLDVSEPVPGGAADTPSMGRKTLGNG